MTALARLALSRLRQRRGRALLSMLGIAAASTMLGAAVTVGYSLHGGFDRAAERSDLPDVIARFDARDLAAVRGRVQTLPNIAAATYRLEERNVHLTTSGEPWISSAIFEGTLPGRRGYAIVAGRDIEARPYEAVVERGLASEWDLHPGDTIRFRTSGARVAEHSLLVVGIGVSSDNVAYPLASGPRIWLPYDVVRAYFAPGQAAPVNQALLWVHDRAQLDATLEQARAASYGETGLAFVTRDGVRVLIDQAAGIVVALLAAFSLVALVAAGVMLAAAARADVQRRLHSFGLLRAVGAETRAIVASVALEAALMAVPAASLGVITGWLLARGPTDRLLGVLDQFPVGRGMAVPLVACVIAVILLVSLTAAWPTWRACRRPIPPLLRGGDVATTARGSWLPGGPLGLGIRLLVSRPTRTVATSLVLTASLAVVLLLLSLAATLDTLETSPGALGKRYDLTARASAQRLPLIRSLPGVAAAAQRFEIDVADSYHLGETFELVAYCGRRQDFESLPLDSGRDAIRPGEGVVGLGLATALGLAPGSTLAAQFSDGDELRIRVVGIVRALENDGRIAYLQPRVDICEFHGGATVIRLAPGADRSKVIGEIERAGFSAVTVGGVTARNASFLGILAALLRLVALVDGVVCLYAMIQVLALTAYERRSSTAVLRALGAGSGQIATVFLGAALGLALIATVLAVILQREFVGPRAANLAASYATVSLTAGSREIALAAGGATLIAAGSAVWVARRALREPIASALREG